MTDRALELDATPPAELRPTCSRCIARAEQARYVAAGHGTIAEIREAIDLLELERASGLPLGETITIAGGAHVCPYCTRNQDGPLVASRPNRATRRRTRIR